MKIKPYINNDKTVIQYIDLELENTSNRSIDFDVEMKVFKGEENSLITKREFTSLAKSQNLISERYIVHLPNLKVSVEEFDDYCLLSHNMIRPGSKTTMSLAQNESMRDLFEQELIVIAIDGTVKVEVTIRSDDFTEGALVKKFDVEIVKN